MARAAAVTNYSDTQNKLICANILLSKFADVNIANEDGDTPLIAALEQGNTNLHIIALLLHYGADVYHKNRHGRSALSIAIESKNTEIIKLLVTGRNIPQWAYDAITTSLTVEESIELLDLSSNIPSLYNLSRLAVVKDMQENVHNVEQKELDVINHLLTKGDDEILETVSKYPATVFTPRNRAPIAR
ncbi:cortactin-binding protein 2-like [Bolinopsis microptera]|uniref:cortactin-binding protein 2-like n=1 Tax=Bolinopsis microptera TaxID=2820187 RepID=UPI00307985CE